MRLQTRTRAGLLLLAITGTIIVSAGSAQAHHRHRGCCGGCGGYAYYGGGGCGGGCATGGCATGGCATGGCATGGCATGGCAPHAMYMNQPAGTYVTQNGGCGPMTTAYPPAAPAPGQPGAYNGANYESAPPTPTYAPGTYAPPGAPLVNGQRGNTAEQHNAARPPAMGDAPQPNGDTAGQPNAAASASGTRTESRLNERPSQRSETLSVSERCGIELR